MGEKDNSLLRLYYVKYKALDVTFELSLFACRHFTVS